MSNSFLSFSEGFICRRILRYVAAPAHTTASVLKIKIRNNHAMVFRITDFDLLPSVKGGDSCRLYTLAHTMPSVGS